MTAMTRLAMKRADLTACPERVTSVTSTTPRPVDTSTPTAGLGGDDLEVSNALSDINGDFYAIPLHWDNGFTPR